MSFVSKPPLERPLAGCALFLSASVPSLDRAERYRRIEDAHLEIEEAVISLARAVFAQGGTLVFGGHPAISPLVAMVAGEYIGARFVEGQGEEVRPPIQIYQSRAFEGYLPDETLMMFRAGYATLHWTEVIDGERFDPRLPRDQPRCPQSLRHMRETIVREMKPVALVGIGGMEGVEEEVEIFRRLRRGKPIYIYGETGGAATLLADSHGEEIRVIDREILERLEPLRLSQAREQKSRLARKEPEKPVTPYPLIAQMLVGELIQLNDQQQE